MKYNRLVSYAVFFLAAGIFLYLAVYFSAIYILQKSYNPYFVENNYTLHYFPFIFFALIFILIKGIFSAKKNKFDYLWLLFLLASASIAMYFPERITYKEYIVGENKYQIQTSYMPNPYYKDSDLVGFIVRVSNLNFDPAWPDAKNIDSKLIDLKVAKADFFSEAIKFDIKERAALKEWFYSKRGSEKIYSLNIGEHIFLSNFYRNEIIRCQKGYENCTLYIQKDNGILYSLYIHDKISLDEVYGMFKLIDRIENKIASFEVGI